MRGIGRRCYRRRYSMEPRACDSRCREGTFWRLLRNLCNEEVKARKLLKKKRFDEAHRDVEMSHDESVRLANSLLTKGKAARGTPTNNPTYREIVAYSRRVLDFVDAVLGIAAGFSVQVFASVVAADAPRPDNLLLRKDYVYLFERYFYFLETLPPRDRGLIVFDELDKAQSHILLQQMAAYFLGTRTGQYRSSRIVPEPFFVHSDLATGVFLADLVAYILGWGWRLASMPQASRVELRSYATKIHEMQFHGEKPKETAAATGSFTESSTWTTCMVSMVESITESEGKKRRQ
jgi:hypothetical protein